MYTGKLIKSWKREFETAHCDFCAKFTSAKKKKRKKELDEMTLAVLHVVFYETHVS